MIRDPSDGSVREKPVIETSTTGLAPAMSKEETTELKRLDLSREWLKKYREKLLFKPKQEIVE